MKKFLPIIMLLILALYLTGCAKQEITKSEEPATIDVSEKLKLIIENGPKDSSNPYNYIDKSMEVYNELLAHPKETFEYCIEDLIGSNGENGLKSYIEAILCSTINKNFSYDFSSATDYIESYTTFIQKNYVYLNEYDKYTLSILN